MRPDQVFRIMGEDGSSWSDWVMSYERFLSQTSPHDSGKSSRTKSRSRKTRQTGAFGASKDQAVRNQNNRYSKSYPASRWYR